MIPISYSCRAYRLTPRPIACRFAYPSLTPYCFAYRFSYRFAYRLTHRMATAVSKYDVEKMSVEDVEKEITNILAALGEEATLKALTAMLWKKQDELIAMEEAKEPVEKLAALDTQILKWEELIRNIVAEKECPPWCHNPYCDCRN